MGFDALGLSDELLRAIDEMGYKDPTPIQEKAIPAVFMNRDILGCAQTGTGKTASFTLPMIDILSQGRSRARMPRSLVLSPTRELAQQIAENFESYSKYTNLEMALLIGGTSMREQEQAIDKGVDVLICTPGRMLDLYSRGRIMLNDVKILVIDEADRMMDMGFIPDIETVAQALGPNRQTLFFSATMAPEIRKIADQFLQNPREITVTAPQSTASTVKHFLTTVGPRNKRRALRHFLETEEIKNAIIFCNRKKDIAVLTDSLERHGYASVSLHGDLSQSQRTLSLEYFRAGNVKYLICSDVAARGIDISDLSHVFNFDIPFNAEDYVHRIGRTGRAGKEGRAFSIASPGDAELVEAVEKLINAGIERVALPELEGDEEEAPRRGRGRGRSGNDDSKGRSNAKSGGSSRGRSKDADNAPEKAAEKNADKAPAAETNKKPTREDKRRSRSNHPADKDVGEMPTDPRDFYRPDDSPAVKDARSAFEAHVPSFFVGETPWYDGLEELAGGGSSAREASEEEKPATKRRTKPDRAKSKRTGGRGRARVQAADAGSESSSNTSSRTNKRPAAKASTPRSQAPKANAGGRPKRTPVKKLVSIWKTRRFVRRRLKLQQSA